jgi:hypothetical protein
MKNYDEERHEIIRSMFQAKGRGELIHSQSKISKKLCEHLIKIIAFTDNQACNHWVEEVATWISDNLTSVKLKNSRMAKPYMNLFDEITFPNEDWDYDQVARILKRLEQQYSLVSIRGTREVIDKIDKLGGLLSRNEDLNDKETLNLIMGWRDSLDKD